MVQVLSEAVRNAAEPLPEIESDKFGTFFDRFGDSRVVLIGDASHGTSEFYRARAAITQRLIKEHGFDTVAIEGDWPDARQVDRWVRRHRPTSIPESGVFKHFPQWMWRNREVQSFIDWLEEHNSGLAPDERVRFCGMDLYSMGASILAVIEYLSKVDPDSAAVARKRYGCLEPWLENPQRYGRVALNKGYAPCEAGVVRMLRDMLSQRLQWASRDEEGGESFLDAEMNARLVRDSERYYRAMYYADAESWNLRDSHFFETVARVLKAKPRSKAVVWAHNSHVGDARATGMRDRGELNVGQLCREHFGPEEVSIIGCGTHEGTVAAADEWDMPERIMKVNPSLSSSYERVMHDTGIPSFLLDLRKGHQSEDVRQALSGPLLERFIGVIYWPATERGSHYTGAVLPKQFDGFVWFDKTQAVSAFETAQPKEAAARAETYPFGL
ncbi:putative erythromycin esterase [Lineolata rhizophorae]|uniref:Putative erythromycin esterase n=1 Tax=Lineolata rhizophorae TaxID=578093 RepID=A0A6A6NSU5_9PEZI|nr:putative erythromycin esterase [Lineolata rhizophorae]